MNQEQRNAAFILYGAPNDADAQKAAQAAGVADKSGQLTEGAANWIEQRLTDLGNIEIGKMRGATDQQKAAALASSDTIRREDGDNEKHLSIAS